MPPPTTSQPKPPLSMQPTTPRPLPQSPKHATSPSLVNPTTPSSPPKQIQGRTCPQDVVSGSTIPTGGDDRGAKTKRARLGQPCTRSTLRPLRSELALPSMKRHQREGASACRCRKTQHQQRVLPATPGTEVSVRRRRKTPHQQRTA